MLAQWVPLHAVSCSNLIETGGCAESREIPLRVTQTCSGCCSLRRSHRSSLTTNRESRVHEPSDPTLLFLERACARGLWSSTITLVPPHIPRTRVLRGSTRSRSRLWITILGMPAFLGANFRPREIADDHLIERCRNLPSRHLTTRTLGPVPGRGLFPGLDDFQRPSTMDAPSASLVRYYSREDIRRETSESSAFRSTRYLTETGRNTGTSNRRGAGALASGRLR